MANRNMKVGVENDGEGNWSVVMRVDNVVENSWPVDSLKHGEEMVKACVPVIMPIVQAAILRGEFVSLTAGEEEAA